MDVIKPSVAGTLESSDIMITLEPNTGGIAIDLQSIVEKQFGQGIRRVIRETLASLGVTQAKVIAVDKGALDCVIQARVKTAVYRAADGKAAYNWTV